MSAYFSQPVTEFHGRVLPEPGIPAGYGALVERYELPVMMPAALAAIAVRHHPRSTPAWRMFTPRHAPAQGLAGHLNFAIKWEGIDLAVLAALFTRIAPKDIVELVRARSAGTYSRRLWFLYEWLTGRTLDIPDAKKVKACAVLDNTQQFGLLNGVISSRHRVIDNLPGTAAFCPLVRRTPLLNDLTSRSLNLRAKQVIGRAHPDIIARAAAFLLLSDSRSSFQIEGERPSSQRAARLGMAVAQSGSRPLTRPELERLQRVVIGDPRFVHLGLRSEGAFVGTHDRDTGEPIPQHISARAQDLADLIDGVLAYVERSVGGKLDPVIAAAAAAFGFVYIHPFEDGNGRIHRFLVHHVLARGGFSPPGLVFPISAAILRDIDAYRRVLESYSRWLLPLIPWRATPSGNVEVVVNTSLYYRYFDATAHAEFLYHCVADTIEKDLPDEVAYLQAFDSFCARVSELVDMPSATLDLLHRLLRQTGGHFSKRANEREFAYLTEIEIQQIEKAYADCFRQDGPLAAPSVDPRVVA